MEFEKKAIELFNKLGRERVLSRIHEMGDEAQKEFDKISISELRWNQSSINMMTPEQKEEFHMLKTGYMLCVNEQQEAKERIQQRIKNRKRVMELNREMSSGKP